MITCKHLESLHEGLWVNIENRKGEQSKKMVQEVTPAKALVAKEALRMLQADSQESHAEVILLEMDSRERPCPLFQSRSRLEEEIR